MAHQKPTDPEKSAPFLLTRVRPKILSPFDVVAFESVDETLVCDYHDFHDFGEVLTIIFDNNFLHLICKTKNPTFFL